MSQPRPLIRSARIASRPSRSRGRAIGWMLAILAMVTVGLIVRPFVTGGRARSDISRAKSDMRSLESAIEGYRIDSGQAPPVASIESLSKFKFSEQNLRTWQAEAGPLLGMPHGLTTPIAYISSYFPDPFSKVRGAAHLYYRQGDEWVLLSPGPDKDYDLQDPRPLFRGTGEPDPSILDFTYDPTNGAVSDGDVWRWSPRRASYATTDTLSNSNAAGSTESR